MQRPTSVTVFAILNIVFAAFGLFGALASVMLFVAVGANSNNPVIQVIRDNPAYAAWMKFSIVLGVAVAAVLLAAGIGLLMLKSWARIVSIAYAIYAIVMIPVGTVNKLCLCPASDAATGARTAGAGSRPRHWRAGGRNHRQLFWAYLSDFAADLHAARQCGRSVPAADT